MRPLSMRVLVVQQARRAVVVHHQRCATSAAVASPIRRSYASAASAVTQASELVDVLKREDELAASLQREGRYADSLMSCRVVAQRASFEAQKGDAASSTVMQDLAFRGKSRLAFAMLQVSDYPGCVTQYEELLGANWAEEKTFATAKERGERAKMLSNYSEALAHVGRADTAFKAAEVAVELVSGNNRAGLEKEAAGVLCNQASLLAVLGNESRTFDAVNTAQEALDLASSAFGRTHDFTRTCLRALAFASAKHGGEPQVAAIVDDWVVQGKKDRAELEATAKKIFDEVESRPGGLKERLPKLEQIWSQAPLRRFDPPGVIIPSSIIEPGWAAFKKSQQ